MAVYPSFVNFRIQTCVKLIIRPFSNPFIIGGLEVLSFKKLQSYCFFP